MAQVYGEEYFRSEDPVGHGYEDYSQMASSHIRMARRKARIVRRYVTGGERLLDLGAAYGYFVRAAIREGFRQAQGLELSAYASRWARTNLGVPVHAGALETADLPAEGFDAVTAWDVLEHTVNAREAMERIAGLLAPGGYFFLTVPDVGSLWALAMRNWWFGYNKDDHTYFFSRRTVRRLVEESGLEWVGSWTHPWSCTIGYAVQRLAHYSRTLTKAVSTVVGPLGLLEKDIDFPLIDILAVARRPMSGKR